MVIIVLFFRETRGSVLLSRKARKLNEWYEACEDAGYRDFAFAAETAGDASRVSSLRWRVKADEERASLLKMVKISSTRPFVLLFTEPTVFFFSLWISFSVRVFSFCLLQTYKYIVYQAGCLDLLRQAWSHRHSVFVRVTYCRFGQWVQRWLQAVDDTVRVEILCAFSVCMAK